MRALLLFLLVISALAQTIPTGTAVVVRTIEAVDSKTADPGKTFEASLDEPLIVNSSTLAPKGAKVLLKVTEVKESGKFKGSAGLTIALASVQAGSGIIALDSEPLLSESAGKGSSTAKKVGIGGGIGAIAGGLLGGAKGAAIGAAAGAGAGAGISMATSGPTVKIPSETRLTFTTR